MVKAVFPGSFDPPTNGHMNLIRRAAGIFGGLDVVIAVNANKQYLFNAEERFELMSNLLADDENVHLHLWDKLIVDFADKVGAKVLVRGVRAFSDFGYEFELAMTNKGLNSKIETIFLPTDPQYFVLRSSAIKDIAMFNGDISMMVPKLVENALKRKFTGS